MSNHTPETTEDGHHILRGYDQVTFKVCLNPNGGLTYQVIPEEELYHSLTPERGLGKAPDGLALAQKIAENATIDTPVEWFNAAREIIRKAGGV